MIKVNKHTVVQLHSRMVYFHTDKQDLASSITPQSVIAKDSYM